MNPEADTRLASARRLLNRGHDSAATPLPLNDLEDVARLLLERFQATGDNRFFNAFYRISAPLFAAYCRKVLSRFPGRIEALAVTNRLYTILFRKLIAPRRFKPIAYLFPWCYRVLLNLIREEHRKNPTYSNLPIEAALLRERASTIDTVIRREENEQAARLSRRVLEILHNGKAGFSRRDRRIMCLFYLEKLSLREIADRTDLTASHVAVVLKRSRDKIAKMIRRNGLENDGR